MLLALAEDRDDSGGAAADLTAGRPGATFIDCGLPAGYFAQTFDRLHALADEAVRLGRDVVWA